MANWFVDRKDGSDSNGGTSWADAKQTLSFSTGLFSLGAVGDHYWLKGWGESFPYSLTSEGPTQRNWHGVRTRDGRQGMPIVIGLGNPGDRLRSVGNDALYMGDLWIRNCLNGVNGKLGGYTDDRDVVERCIFEDVTFGMDVKYDNGPIIFRYNVVFASGRGVRWMRTSVDRHFQSHHNSYHGCAIDGGDYIRLGDGYTVGFDALHSNVYMNGVQGIYAESGGTLILAVGEPDYCVWYGNTADIVASGHAMTKGAHAINADPQFFDVVNKDLRLVANSPALYSDAASKSRGALGPGAKALHRMRLGKFFSKPGELIEANTIWRDYNLIGT